MAIVLVHITHKNMDEAKKIAMYVMKRRLIACVNFYPGKSMYYWEDKITDDEEVVTIMKTTEEMFSELKSTVEDIHPYKVPCILKMPVEANEEFEKWVNEQLNP